MRTANLIFILILLTAIPHYSQNSNLYKKCSFMVIEGENFIKLETAISPFATDSIDRSLGEEELPPLPPYGIFDARFTGRNIGINIGNGILKDYRFGNNSTSFSAEHQITIQKAANENIIIKWSLPEGVDGYLKDFFGGAAVNEYLTKDGRVEILNKNITDLLLLLNYTETTSVQNTEDIYNKLYMPQNYPNPFNSSTVFKFTLPQTSRVSGSLYDINGMKVLDIFDEVLFKGENSVSLKADNLSSGIYLFVLKTGGFSACKKFVVLK